MNPIRIFDLICYAQIHRSNLSSYLAFYHGIRIRLVQPTELDHLLGDSAVFARHHL